jgi:predicted ATPase
VESHELLGRDPVVAFLGKAMTSGDDHGQALLLLGESGIGKTACLRVAAAMAREAGHLVLETAGTEAETSLAYAGLHRLLQPLLGSVDALPSVQRQALLAALGMRDGAKGDQFIISVATLNLLRAGSEERTLVVAADDVQWLDEDTRHVLAFVTRRLERHRVIVIVTSSVAGLPDSRDVFREECLERLDESTAHRLLQQHAGRLHGTAVVGVPRGSESHGERPYPGGDANAVANAGSSA